MERFAAQPNYTFGPSPPGNNIRDGMFSNVSYNNSKNATTKTIFKSVLN
jgi:hypothetical protein